MYLFTVNFPKKLSAAPASSGSHSSTENLLSPTHQVNTESSVSVSGQKQLGQDHGLFSLLIRSERQLDIPFKPIQKAESEEIRVEKKSFTQHTPIIVATTTQSHFSETVAIDTGDHRPVSIELQALTPGSKKTKISAVDAYTKAQPLGVRMEAKILTSRLDLTRTKRVEALGSQRQELLLQLDGAAPRFVRRLRPQKVMDGTRAQLACRIYGTPMPAKVEWLHKGKSVSDNPDFQVAYDQKTGDTTLTIADVFPQDSGLFECHASNVYGNAATKANLTVDGE